MQPQVLPAALPTLLRQMMHRITGRMIDVNFVNDLLVPDTARSYFVGSILHNNKAQAAQWSAFRNKCVTDLNFDPDVDGELAAALNLGLRHLPAGSRSGNATPTAQPSAGVKARLRRAQPGLFETGSVNGGEDQLRQLADLTTLAADGAATK